MSSNIFTEDKKLITENQSVFADQLLYKPIVPSLCDGSPNKISADDVFDKQYETRTYQLSQNAEDNITRLATPARTGGKQLHSRQVNFKYRPYIEEAFYETSTRKRGDELDKELNSVTGSTIDLLNEHWDLAAFLGEGGEYGGYRNSNNTVLDESHNINELSVDFIKLMLKEKLRELQKIAPITSTDLSMVDFVFTPALSNLIYDYDRNTVSYIKTLQELFPGMEFIEAKDTFRTNDKEFMGLSFRRYLKMHQGTVPALTERERKAMENKVISKYEYCSAAVEVKQYGSVQFIELQP